MSDRELIYVGDPMCSWCWGMSPVLAAAPERFEMPLRVVVGGLRTGTARIPLGDRSKQTIAHHWHRVEEVTGQPFDHSFFDRDDFVYDTELSCRAVVAARDLDPAAAFPYFERLQRAFYAENIDITSAEALADLAVEEGLEAAAFVSRLESPAIHDQTQADFSEARQLGVTGYPSLLLTDHMQVYPLSFGYAPMEQIEALLGGWIGQLDAADAEACDIDGLC